MHKKKSGNSDLNLTFTEIKIKCLNSNCITRKRKISFPLWRNNLKIITFKVKENVEENQNAI